MLSFPYSLSYSKKRDNYKLCYETMQKLKGVKGAMDEMKIVSKFMRGVISKAVKVIIHKKLGYDTDIRFNECDITFDGNKAHVHINVDTEIDKTELLKMLKEIGI